MQGQEKQRQRLQMVVKGKSPIRRWFIRSWQLPRTSSSAKCVPVAAVAPTPPVVPAALPAAPPDNSSDNPDACQRRSTRSADPHSSPTGLLSTTSSSPVSRALAPVVKSRFSLKRVPLPKAPPRRAPSVTLFAEPPFAEPQAIVAEAGITAAADEENLGIVARDIFGCKVIRLCGGH